MRSVWHDVGHAVHAPTSGRRIRAAKFVRLVIPELQWRGLFHPVRSYQPNSSTISTRTPVSSWTSQTTVSSAVQQFPEDDKTQ